LKKEILSDDFKKRKIFWKNIEENFLENCPYGKIFHLTSLLLGQLHQGEENSLDGRKGNIRNIKVGLQVLTASTEDESLLGDCSLVEVDRRFRGGYCLHHQSDCMTQ
jgi:hypothetical protein